MKPNCLVKISTPDVWVLVCPHGCDAVLCQVAMSEEGSGFIGMGRLLGKKIKERNTELNLTTNQPIKPQEEQIALISKRTPPAKFNSLSLKTELWRSRAWAPRVSVRPDPTPVGWSRALVAVIRAGVRLHPPRRQTRGCLSPSSSHIRRTPPLLGVAKAVRQNPGGASNQPAPIAHARRGPVQFPALLVFLQLALVKSAHSSAPSKPGEPRVYRTVEANGMPIPS